MEMATMLKLMFVFCMVGLIQTIEAINVSEFDEYWTQRADEARKFTLEAYHSDPLEIVDHFHERHYDISTDLPETDEEITKHDSTDVPESEDTSFENAEAEEIEEEEEEEDEEVIEMVGDSKNSTRRNLRGRGRGGKWSKLRGPCTASNPIDKCWRCRPDWHMRRKRLARCVRGFGHKTTGGKRGRIYVVTSNLDEDVINPKPGTLRHAVIQKEPLWIIFKNDMNIKLSQELLVNSHKTIDARGSNVHIAHGAGITLQFVNNIIIHGLHVHHVLPSNGGMIRDSVDHFGFRTRADGDGISVFGSSNIWLDHISMSNGQDGLIDVIFGSTGITISNSHFTHHNDVMLLGAQNTNEADKKMQVTVAYNHFGKGLVQRMPRIRWGFVHVVNNDYTHWELYAIGGSQSPTILSHGNRFIAPPHKPHYREVTKRDYAPEDEWKHWNWRSSKDMFMNGAYFRESGDPNYMYPHNRLQMIKPKGGFAVSSLTKYAGALDCRVGRKC